MMAKVADDLLMVGKKDIIEEVMAKLKNRIKFVWS